MSAIFELSYILPNFGHNRSVTMPMDSALICIDNGYDSDFDVDNMELMLNQMTMAEEIAKDINLKHNRNPVSLMVPQPKPKIILEFTTNMSDINDRLNMCSSIYQTSKGADNDFVQCLCVGRKQLEKVVSMRKSFYLFSKTRIQWAEDKFRAFATSMIRDCSQIHISVILFGPKVREISSLFKPLFGRDLPFISIYLLNGRTPKEMLEELTNYGVIDIPVNRISNLMKTKFTPRTDTSGQPETWSPLREHIDEETRKALQLSVLEKAEDISAGDREAIRAALEDLDSNHANKTPEVSPTKSTEEKKELGINTLNNRSNLKSEEEINRMRERLKTEELDEQTRKAIEETITYAIDSLNGLKSGDNVSQNVSNNVTEDELQIALRLSLIENKKTEESKPMKKKVKKFKEGIKDD